MLLCPCKKLKNQAPLKLWRKLLHYYCVTCKPWRYKLALPFRDHKLYYCKNRELTTKDVTITKSNGLTLCIFVRKLYSVQTINKGINFQSFKNNFRVSSWISFRRLCLEFGKHLRTESCTTCYQLTEIQVCGMVA